MNDVESTLDQYLLTYADQYGQHKMTPRVKGMWQKRVMCDNPGDLSRAFENCLGEHQYAFTWGKLSEEIRAVSGRRKAMGIKIRDADMPPKDPKGLAEMNHVIRMDAKYRSGLCTWEDFADVALPFAGKVSEEDAKTGQKIIDRIEMLRAMKIVKPEKPIEPKLVLVGPDERQEDQPKPTPVPEDLF